MAFQGSHWAGETDDVGDAGVTHHRVMLSNAPGWGALCVLGFGYGEGNKGWAVTQAGW